MLSRKAKITLISFLSFLLFFALVFRSGLLNKSSFADDTTPTPVERERHTEIHNSSSVTIEKLEAKIVEVTSDSGSVSVIDDDGYHVIGDLLNQDKINIKAEINYAISGEGPYEPGKITIAIPDHLLKTSDTFYQDKIELSVPVSPNCSEQSDYNYTYNASKKEYVITNCKTLPGGAEAKFELYYSQNKYSLSSNTYVDMEKQAPFYAKLSVDFNGEIATAETDNDYFKVNTSVEITGLVKKHGRKYYTTGSSDINNDAIFYKWQNSWGEEPIDSDDYFYFAWGFRIETNNVSQFADIIIDDNQINGEPVYIYGVRGSKGYSSWELPPQRFDSGSNVTYRLDKYISCYGCGGKGGHIVGTIITKVLKNSLNVPGNNEIVNNLTVTIKPLDNIDSSTSITYPSKAKVNLLASGDLTVPNGETNFYKSTPIAPNNPIMYDSDTPNMDVELGSWPLNTYLTDSDMTKNSDGEYFKIARDVIIVDDKLYFLKDNSRSSGVGSFGNPSGGDRKVLLDVEDYDFTYVDLSQTNSLTSNTTVFEEYYYDETTRKTVSKQSTNIYDKFFIYGKWNNEWIELGYYNYNESIRDFVFTSYDDSLITNIYNYRISLAEGCKGIKVIFSSALYLKPSFYLGVKLNSTNNVNNLFSNTIAARIINEAHIDVKQGNNIYFSKTGLAWRNFSSYEYTNSNKEEKSVVTNNDTANKRVVLKYKVKVGEGGNTKNLDIDHSLLPDKSNVNIQSSAVFYDLLPVGTTFSSLDKIYPAYAFTGSEYEIPKNNYNYSIIDNYNNTGRQLLIVNIVNNDSNFFAYKSEPYVFYGSGFAIDYTLYYPWDSIYDYGKTVYNDFIYESGTNLLNGKKNDGTDDLKIDNQEIYKNIGTRSDEPVYLAGKVTTTLNYPTSAELGLYKRVKGLYDAQYSNEGQTDIGSTYSYKLHFGSSTNTSTSNMILFDSLENYHEEGLTENSWHGIFDDIDVSQPKLKGIDPVVYYSEISNLDLETNNDISNESVWKKLTDETDKTKVKAIAVDMRKGTNGNNYVLEEGETINVVIYMKSPVDNETIYNSLKNNAYAYNNVYLKNDLTPKGGTTTPMFIHQDYTKIRLNEIDTSYTFVKKDHKTGEVIPNVRFFLSGTSYTGQEYNLEAISDEEGKVTFEGLKYNIDGYTITEEAPLGYLKEAESYKLVIDGKYENDEYSLFGKLYNGEELLDDVIYNSPYTSLKLRKMKADIEKNNLSLEETLTGLNRTIPKLTIDNENYSDGRDYLNAEHMSNVAFTLRGTTLDNQAVERVFTTDEEGYINIDSIAPGDYELIEGVSEYDVVPSSWIIKINADHSIVAYEKGSINFDNTSYYEEDNTIYLWNDKVYNLVLTEVSELEETFEFRLELKKLKKSIMIDDPTKIEIIKGTIMENEIAPEEDEIILKVTLRPTELISLRGLIHTADFHAIQETTGYTTSYNIKDTEIFKEDTSLDTDSNTQGRRDVTITFRSEIIPEEPDPVEPDPIIPDEPVKPEEPKKETGNTKVIEKVVERLSTPLTSDTIRRYLYILSISMIVIGVSLIIIRKIK